MRSVDIFILAAVAAVCSCGGTPPGHAEAPRLVVLGPSLAELACEGGLEDLVCGVDRYTVWPPSIDSLPRLGGYLDPSLEALAALNPTDVLSVGHSAEMESLCGLVGARYRSFGFDTYEDVIAACESLETIWGADLSEFREGLESTLDSIRLSVGADGPRVAVVVWHEPGDGVVTLAGHGTWYDDLFSRMGMELMAPRAGTYPAVSVEGVLSLAPDRILHLFPGMAGDSVSIIEAERGFWTRSAFPPERVLFAFEDHVMIPGARLALTARRFGELCGS